jgi:hypothetical protein
MMPYCDLAAKSLIYSMLLFVGNIGEGYCFTVVREAVKVITLFFSTLLFSSEMGISLQ